MRKSLEEEKDWRSKETVAERAAEQRKSSLEQDKKTALAMKGAWIKGSPNQCKLLDHDDAQ